MLSSRAQNTLHSYIYCALAISNGIHIATRHTAAAASIAAGIPAMPRRITIYDASAQYAIFIIADYRVSPPLARFGDDENARET